MRYLNKVLGYFRDNPVPEGCISKKRIKRYLGENITILEAGAANGSDTLELSNIFPKSKIYAMEPVPFLFEQLSEMVKNCSNVEIFPFALGEKSGISSLNLSRNTQGSIVTSSSLLKPKLHLQQHPQILFNDDIVVKTLTIDDFCLLYNIERIDFLWLDLQGVEYNVLKASPETLKKAKVIHAEVSLINTYENVILYPDFKKWMLSEGFNAVIEELPFTDMGNVLFVRNNH